jgi:hypothetical protein
MLKSNSLDDSIAAHIAAECTRAKSTRAAYAAYVAGPNKPSIGPWTAASVERMCDTMTGSRLSEGRLASLIEKVHDLIGTPSESR